MPVKRNTNQRRIVLETLKNSESHPTATALYEEIHQIFPKISKSTVFRILAAEAEDGAIQKIYTALSEDRYDFNTSPHYHVRCVECGQVSDVKMDFLNDLEVQIQDSSGYRVSGHSIEFTGMCPCCTAHKSSGDKGLQV